MLSREVMHVCLTRGLGYQDVTIFEDSDDLSAGWRSSRPAGCDLLDIHMSRSTVRHAARDPPG